jgi:uncharacterized membrane protein
MKNIESQTALSPSPAGSPFFWLTVGLSSIYAVVFGYLSIAKFQSFHCGVFDIGVMIQTFWNTAQGRLMEESVNLGFPISRLWVAHAEVIYIPLSLIYKLLPSPNTILILQSIFLAAGAIPVYLLARHHLGHELLAVSFAVAYLLYPGMQNANLTDVHGLAFSPALLLFAFYFLQNRRYVAFWIFAVLALWCREDIAILLFMMSLYAFFILKERRIGAGLCALSLFWLFMALKGRYFIMDWAGVTLNASEDPSRSHWSQLDSGRVIFKRPFYFLDEILLTKLNVRYLIDVLGPLAFLSLLAPFELAMAAPIFAIYLLGDWVAAKSVSVYYAAPIIPFVFISAIMGLHNLRVYWERRLVAGKNFWSTPRFAGVVGFLIVTLSLAFFSLESNARQAGAWKRTPRHEKIDMLIARIPSSASLSADLYLGTHAAERREFCVFPERLDKVEYVLYDFYAPEYRFMTRDTFFLPVEHPLNPPIRQVLHSGAFGCIWFDDGIALFKRGIDRKASWEKLAFAEESEIRERADVAVGGLQFRGYTRQIDARIFEKRVLHFTTFWKRRDLVAGDRFVYQLSNGAHVYEFANEPAWGLWPIAEWPENKLIRDEVYWDIPADLPNGEFEIAVKLEKAAMANGDADDDKAVKLLSAKIR